METILLMLTDRKEAKLSLICCQTVRKKLYVDLNACQLFVMFCLEVLTPLTTALFKMGVGKLCFVLFGTHVPNNIFWQLCKFCIKKC